MSPPYRVTTRQRVAELHEAGMGTVAIAERLALSRSTVSYHLRRLGQVPDPRFLRRYDWPAVQRYYDEGHTVAECRSRFGFAIETWNSAVARGAIVPRPRAMPLDELLAGPRNRSHLKARLLRAGLKEDRCERCGLSEWQGGALSLQLHHVNGDGQDNRLENLEILCPNCHAQTPNWGGRNARRGAA